jgi:hypothetical protein
VITYRIQGRRTDRDPDGKVCDVVRLESAASRSAAFEIAEVLSAQRLTVWVFAAEPRAGKLRYRLLGVLPDSGT